MPPLLKDSDSNNFPAKLERWFFLPPLGALLLLFLLQFVGSNEAVFLWLNRNCQFAGETFWMSLTTFGDGLVAWILVLPFVRRQPRLVWTMLLSSLLVLLWVQGLKHFTNMPRPAVALSAEDFKVIGVNYQSKSFPSGHAATAAMFAATFCLFCRQKWVRVAACAAALLVCLSRIAMGIHWPTDVLAGFLGGWLSAILGYQAAQRWRFGVSLLAQIIFGVSMIAEAIVMLIYNHTDYAQTFMLQRMVALGALVCFFSEMVFDFRRGRLEGLSNS